MPTKAVVGSIAAVVLLARHNDVQHIPRLVLEKGSPVAFLKIVASATAVYVYEKLNEVILHQLGLARLPSTLAAMLGLFGMLRIVQKCCGRDTSDILAHLLQPGVDFLGKWMGLFLAPPLASLDNSIAHLPHYGLGVWGNAIALLGVGWAATHATAGAVASGLAPRRNAGTTQKPNTITSGLTTAAAIAQKAEVPLDEAVRRAWIVLAAIGYLGVAGADVLPAQLHRPLGMLCQISTAVNSFTLGKLLPSPASRVLHPIVICAVASNLASRLVGPSAPFLDAGHGVGDFLFQWLAAAVTGLGVRMYSTTALWLDNSDDFRCVLVTCSVSACFSLLFASFGAVAPQSPLGLPAPLSLPLLHRSVMSALGIDGSLVVGPECDPKLAVASILITGCLGASLGKALLEALPAVFDTSSPLVRGVAMGCSAHSIGTAGLISQGDTEAAAISGAAMCLTGTAHTLALQVPGVVIAIRHLAGL